jgi:hypothetical protein
MGDVADGDPAGRPSVFAAEVGMSVDRELGGSVVDRLSERGAAEHGIQPARLAFEGVGHGSEVRQRDS